MNSISVFAVCLVLAFVMTALISRYLIPILKSKKMGQKILDIGPRWHKSKEGTPTMGGIAFLIAVSVIGAVFCVVYAFSENNDSAQLCGLALALALGLCNGLVGILPGHAVKLALSGVSQLGEPSVNTLGNGRGALNYYTFAIRLVLLPFS